MTILQPVYPKIILEVFNGTTFDDITKDVLGNIECTYGIRANSVIDRVANVGELKFTLRNDAGCTGGVENYYTPGTISTKVQWVQNTAVRLKFVYRTETVTKFVGHTTDINVDLENRKVDVICCDWLDYAEKMPMKLTAYEENKTIGEVTDLILGVMSYQPANKKYGIAANTFTSIFDTVKNRTKAIGEFQKLALSEMGYIYIRQDPYKGETLTVDGMATRNGNTQSKVPVIDNYLADEMLNDLLTESGENIVVIESAYAELDNQAYAVDMEYGKRVVNIINAKYYPRKIDTTLQVLYSLDSPIYLAAGTTNTIEVDYKDPSSTSNSVAGKDMINPVADTDYKMYANSDATGTDLTGNLTVTATYYATKINYTLTNSGATAGYITTLQARGYGIYIYNPADYSKEEVVSIGLYGEKELSLDLKYLNSPTRAKYYADCLMPYLHYPSSIINSFSFKANTSESTLLMFLFMDCGDMVKIVDDKSYITNHKVLYFYINGVSFSVTPGGVIDYSWIVLPYTDNQFD